MQVEKIYVAFDLEKDLKYFKEMETWKDSKGNNFNLINGYEFLSELDKVNDDILKAKLQEKMRQAEMVVIILGTGTKSMRKLTRWQVEYAINNYFPIVVMNLNRIQSVDYDRCPTVLKTALAIHTTFDPSMLELAINDWPNRSKTLRSEEKKGAFKYGNDIYKCFKAEEVDE